MKQTKFQNKEQNTHILKKFSFFSSYDRKKIR